MSRSVIVVGDVVTDVVARLEAAPQAGTDTPAEVRISGGGAGANVAAWLAGLGVDVTLCARIGDDPQGRLRVQELELAGVRLALQVDDSLATGTVVVIVDEAGMPLGVGADAPPNPSALPNDSRLLARPRVGADAPPNPSALPNDSRLLAQSGVGADAPPNPSALPNDSRLLAQSGVGADAPPNPSALPNDSRLLARTMLADRGANLALSVDELPAGLVVRGAHLHVSGYALLHDGPRPAALAAMELARAAEATLSVTAASAAPLTACGPERFAAWTSAAELCFANADEARILTGKADPATAVRDLAQGYEAAVVTCGRDGAMWSDGDRVVSQPALPTTVVDTTGAGDAFAAGFLAAWLNGLEPRECLRAGARTAARAIASPGARPPT